MVSSVDRLIISLLVLIPIFPVHEAAAHSARLRLELSRTKTEQMDYLKNVELARVLDKRAARKRERAEKLGLTDGHVSSGEKPSTTRTDTSGRKPNTKSFSQGDNGAINDVLAQIF